VLLFYSLQAILPLLLITWLILFSPRNILGYFAQLVSVGLAIVTLILVGIYLFPPWWLPYLYLAAYVGVVLLQGIRCRGFRTAMPGDVKEWLQLFVNTVLILFVLTQLIPALSGRKAPELAVDLSFPLTSGDYLIVSGGNSTNINSHLMTLDETVPRFENWRGQSYALDIVRVNKLGLRSSGIMPSDPADYFIYGQEVIAPCGGEVMRAVNNIEDNQVPVMNRDAMSGNHVVIRCENVEVILAHMITGSVVVAVGQQVSNGQLLGLAGNSGNSGEPHLHIHVQATGAPADTLDANPLAFTINGKYWLRNQIMHIR
jgi:hypothetical protein